MITIYQSLSCNNLCRLYNLMGILEKIGIYCGITIGCNKNSKGKLPILNIRIRVIIFLM